MYILEAFRLDVSDSDERVARSRWFAPLIFAPHCVLDGKISAEGDKLECKSDPR